MSNVHTSNWLAFSTYQNIPVQHHAPASKWLEVTAGHSDVIPVKLCGCAKDGLPVEERVPLFRRRGVRPLIQYISHHFTKVWVGEAHISNDVAGRDLSMIYPWYSTSIIKWSGCARHYYHDLSYNIHEILIFWPQPGARRRSSKAHHKPAGHGILWNFSPAARHWPKSSTIPISTLPVA